MPHEDNMLLATWLDSKQSPQNESDEKLLFFLNETLLERKSVNAHFQLELNKKLFLEKNIEFMCRKGPGNEHNQDNFFILLDGEVKIYGLFDGHGTNGLQVSSFAQSKVLDFIRNKHGAFFDQVNLQEATDVQIKSKIKQCFKYVQQELKKQYKMYRRINAAEEQTRNRYKLPDPNTNFLVNLLNTRPAYEETYPDYTENNSNEASSHVARRPNSAS